MRAVGDIESEEAPVKRFNTKEVSGIEKKAPITTIQRLQRRQERFYSVFQSPARVG